MYIMYIKKKTAIGYLSKSLVRIPMLISPDSITKMYTIRVIRAPSPRRYSTRLKLNKPTNPQLIHPIILRTRVVLNSVFIISSLIIIFLPKII